MIWLVILSYKGIESTHACRCRAGAVDLIGAEFGCVSRFDTPEFWAEVEERLASGAWTLFRFLTLDPRTLEIADAPRVQ